MHSLRSCRFAITVLVALSAGAAAAQPTPAPPTPGAPSTPPAAAPTPPPIRDPKAFATDFVGLIEKNEAQAYNSLKSTGLNSAGIDNLRQTAARLTASMGPIRGSEFLDEAHLGKRLLRLTFIVLHQRGPVVQTFTYYMPPGATDWQLIAVDITAEPGRFPFPPGK
jgi:hypothetical protein